MSAAGTLPRFVLAAVAGLLAGPSGHAQDKLIGTRPSPWQVADWINSKPLTLESLAGKVVLVRWWTAPLCPYCAATAPSLNEFYSRYKGRGLVVVGFYHHKAPTPFRVADVKRAVEGFGFQFPVAVDAHWRTLHHWWLDGREHAWTSVSFLIDRKGVVRHVHPGGKYVKGDKDYAALKARIEELLKKEE